MDGNNNYNDPLTEMLEYNKRFVEEKMYEQYATSKYPDRKIAIVTCMDTRLVQLLPAALGIKNGDVKIIKNAGGTITNPFDSTVRSLLVAIYELGVNEVMIIGHTGCGVQGMDGAEMLELMRERGIDEEHISLMKRWSSESREVLAQSMPSHDRGRAWLKHCGIDLESWLHGFDETDAAVLETVDLVKNHPLVPKDVIVKGYIMDSVTGKLMPIE